MAVGGTLWLTEKFPGRAKTDAADAYEQVWLGYESAFETILAAWDEVMGSGRFDDKIWFCALIAVATRCSAAGRLHRHVARCAVPMCRAHDLHRVSLHFCNAIDALQ